VLSNEDINALFSKAIQLHQRGSISKARLIYKTLLCVSPGASGLLGLIGTALTQEGQHDQGSLFLDRCIRLDQFNEGSRSNLGNALRDLGRFLDAIDQYKKALTVNPAFPDAFRNLGITYGLSNQPNQALSTINHAVVINPQHHEIRNAYGDAFAKLDEHNKALSEFRQALCLDPSYPVANLNYGIALERCERYDKSVISFTRTLIINPKMSEAYLGLGCALSKIKKSAEAFAAVGSAIMLKPNNPRAIMLLGSILAEGEEHRLSMTAFERAYLIDSSLTDCLGSILYPATNSWQWDKVDTYWEYSIKSLNHGESIGTPFNLLMLKDDPELHKIAAKQFTTANKWAKPKAFTSSHPRNDSRIRVGYFSSDFFCKHPVYQNLEPLIRSHNRQEFKLYAFSYSAEFDPSLREIFDEAIDLSSMSDMEAAILAREFGINIAVDLNGHTSGARTKIFEIGAAPVQINYLGYPGSMGTNNHTHIISDRFVIPKEYEIFYSEKVACLPSFFMPYDLNKNCNVKFPKVSRSRYKLPADAFVFCTFNALHKITREIFESWSKIIRACPNSILWMALRGDISERIVLDRFAENGVENNRIVFAERVADPYEHLARLKLADLMLDTYPYNSHTTACDAISVGLPILTLSGKSFASRVCASMLTTIGLTELITTSHCDYEILAITLVHEPNRYQNLRKKVVVGIYNALDPKSYAAQIEIIYKRIIEETLLTSK
jgi:protein O-GlcNAc transferase